MTAPRPIPTLRGEEHLHFAHTKAEELVYQRCRDCEARQWYPRVLCAACGSQHVKTVRSSGLGVIHTFTTTHRAGHTSRGGDVPYTIVLVDLDDGVRVFGELVDVPPCDARVGLPVEADFQHLSEISLLVFRRRHPGDTRGEGEV